MEEIPKKKDVQKQISILFFFIILSAITISFMVVISPFFITIILAVLFAHFSMPLKRFFMRLGMKNRLSAGLTFFIALAVVIVPLTLMIFLVTQEIQSALSGFTAIMEDGESGLSRVQGMIRLQPFMELVENLPFAREILNIFSVDSQSLLLELGVLFKQIAQSIVVILRDAIANIPARIVLLFVMCYLTYFLILEGEEFANNVKTFIPLEEDEKNEVIQESIRIIDATLISTLIVGISEGIIGGTLLYFVGMNASVTWGVLIAVMAMIPILGGNGVLVPIIIYFFITGAYTQGLIIIIFGTGSILLIEYFLKPKIMGDRAGIHPAFLLVGIIGGIYIMGLIGFVVGPFIVSLFFVLWKQFRVKLRKQH